MIRVHVPATSANIGPGYDCLGIAFQWEGIFDFEIIDEGIHIHGCEPCYQNEDNLVYQAFQKTLSYMQESVSGISIGIHCELPVKRGLGSSAACIIAGAMGANALFHNRLHKYELFSICTQIEGHPDNIAPALFGQLTVSFMDQGQPNMIRYGVHPQWRFLALIPTEGIATKQARDILPDTLTYADAVAHMGKCAALCKAIEIGNRMILQKACHDTMHEPYRKGWIPSYERIYEIQKEIGADAMFISGSGSTMMIMSDDENILLDIMQIVQKEFEQMQTKLLNVDRLGAWNEVL